MATVSDLRAGGTTFLAPRREITEPFNAPDRLPAKLGRFESPAFNVSQESHLYHFLHALCGDAGAQGLKKELLYTRLQQQLDATHFSDLDRLYGTPLGIPRISPELYETDPKNEALTSSQWAEVKNKDSLYRSRCLTWMRAIIHGPTKDGIRLAAEAATGYECDVFENYKKFNAEDVYTLINLITNPSFEVDTSGVTTTGSNTLARVTTNSPPFGAGALQVTAGGSGSTLARWTPSTLLGNTAYTFSMYLYIPVNWDGGTFEIWPDASMSTTGTIGSPNMSLRDQWQRVVVTFTTVASPTGNVNLYASPLATTGRTVLVDGVQLEQSAGVTTYCDGNQPGCKWDGTANASTSSRGNYILPVTGKTNSRNEVIIIPRGPTITAEEERRINRLVDRLKPLNTVVTIYENQTSRFERPAVDVVATSDNFTVLRNVTGRSDVAWPEPNYEQGLWITQETNEAPTFAFLGRMESVTYITINSATASTWHTGFFNATQRALFAHLNDIVDPLLDFGPSRSFAHSYAPIVLTTPWIRESRSKTLLVNTYYPIGYFSEANIEQFPSTPPTEFWASQERLPPDSDTLTLDFDRIRPVNFLDFEICNKPIDFFVEYDDDGTWVPITPSERFPVNMSVEYLASTNNSWNYFEMHFDQLVTSKIRITFTRRTDPFPEIESDLFKWSVEVRNLRLMNVIDSVDDYIDDHGTDILGNAYSTSLVQYDAANVLDGDVDTYWESQPNPTKNAVECLYFDLRTGLNLGTQEYLNRFDQEELSGRSQADMEAFMEDGVVIDEVYIDPITHGLDLHIYYSVDDQADWDDKLWIPVPRNYKLHRGYHSLPTPTFAKFVKLEFSNLAAAPYNAVEYPSMLPVTYRKFPSWVRDYFRGIYMNRVEASGPLHGIDAVTIEPLEMGFQTPIDGYHTDFRMRTPTALNEIDDMQDFVAGLDGGGKKGKFDDALRARVETEIDFNPSFMWSEDLLGQLDPTRALTRFVQKAGTGWNPEADPPTTEPPLVQSATDLTPAREEKTQPPMWFPRKCRHQYQVVEAQREGKIAFFVAIREVGFYRRDYQVEFDEAFYAETLDDDEHIEINEFTQSEWRWVVT